MEDLLLVVRVLLVVAVLAVVVAAVAGVIEFLYRDHETDCGDARPRAWDRFGSFVRKMLHPGSSRALR